MFFTVSFEGQIAFCRIVDSMGLSGSGGEFAASNTGSGSNSCRAAGNTCFAQDTLTFRNRIRDGINEWQDENPANYK